MAVKFIGFGFMPYMELPEDFDEKYSSVWVDIPKRLYDPEKGHEMYHEFLDEFEFMVDMGFDGVGVNEHHSDAACLMPSPNLMASILARKVRYSNTALLVLGNSIALYNPPIRIAEEGAMLDVISGGKFIQGFPVGTSMDANYVYGISPAELRERYQEAHDLIIKSWKEDEIFSWNGKYNQLRYVNPWPTPIQKPHPPVWIPGGGSVETYEFTIKNNYQFSYLSFNGWERAKKVLGPYWELVQELGAEMNPYRVGLTQTILVSETDERAKQDYEKHIRYFIEKGGHINPRYAEAPGYRTLKSLRASDLRAQWGNSSRGFNPKEASWEDLIDKGIIVAGSPRTVRDMLRDLVKDLRVGSIFAMMHLGTMPKWLTMKNIQMFAEEVKPYMQDIWSEWDESPYWPKGLTETNQREKVLSK